jgi:FkbM family methyltransferase
LQPTILKTKYAFHLLAAFLKPEVILDIGSMDGADSKRLARLVPKAGVVAFEGNPYNYQAMCADEGLKKKSIKVEHRLVSDKPGKTRFFVQRPEDSDSGFNRGTSSTLPRSMDGAHLEEVVLDAVRVDDFLDNEFPATSRVAAWVDVEGNSYSVLESMDRAANRIKLIHLEVETQEIWPGQRLERDVISLAENMGFVVLARGRDDVQRDVILVEKNWYQLNTNPVGNILAVARFVGPAASRIVETGWWQRFVDPTLSRLLAR